MRVYKYLLQIEGINTYHYTNKRVCHKLKGIYGVCNCTHIYIYIYIYKYKYFLCPKCRSCHKAIMVITVRAHCNPLDKYMYISILESIYEY